MQILGKEPSSSFNHYERVTYTLPPYEETLITFSLLYFIRSLPTVRYKRVIISEKFFPPFQLDFIQVWLR